MIDEIIADLRRRAKNMERYPFESATMAEAGKLAANALRSIANEYAQGIDARSGGTDPEGESQVPKECAQKDAA